MKKSLSKENKKFLFLGEMLGIKKYLFFFLCIIDVLLRLVPDFLSVHMLFL